MQPKNSTIIEMVNSFLGGACFWAYANPGSGRVLKLSSIGTVVKIVSVSNGTGEAFVKFEFQTRRWSFSEMAGISIEAMDATSGHFLGREVLYQGRNGEVWAHMKVPADIWFVLKAVATPGAKQS